MPEELKQESNILFPTAGPLIYAIVCTLSIPIFLILIAVIMTITWPFIPFVAYYQRKSLLAGNSPDSKVSLLNENQSDLD